MAILSALVASTAVVWLSGSLKEAVHAQGVGVVTMGFDMVIDDDGDTTPDNFCANDGVTDCTLGPIDECIQVPEAAGLPDDIPELYFDIVLKDLPQNESVLLVGYDIVFPVAGAAGVLATQDHLGGVSQGLIVGNSLENQPGSSQLDLSEGVPDVSPPLHDVAVSDLGAAEYSPPITQGPLGRYGFDISGLPPGLYSFTFGIGSFIMKRDTQPVESMFDPGGVFADSIDDEGDTTADDDIVLDGNAGYGVLAVGVPCSAAPAPVGGIAEYPDIAESALGAADSAGGSATSLYAALAGGLAAGVVALVTVAWWARRRWLR